MFKTDTDAINYIEKQIVKRSFDDYLKILKKYQIKIDGLFYIHVTGTNGKGSTINYLSNLIQASNHKVGTFTSPYMISYHDRICINGVAISSTELLRIVNEYEHIIVNEKLSKFEIDVLIMLVYFHEQQVDYAIIEVGIGGKTDKTNVIDANIALITNIGYDHMPSLGTTLLEVTEHKAGIIKKGCTVITTEHNKECLKVIEKTSVKQNAKLIQLEQCENNETSINYKNWTIDLGDVALYQKNNAILALAAFSELSIELDAEVVQSVMKDLLWPGRFEKIIGYDKTIYIDGAHNIDGIKALLKSISSLEGKTIIIFSALKDKDYNEMIKLLNNKYDVYVTVFKDERQIDVQDLSNYDNVFDSFDLAFNQASMNGDNIVITGSLHFISSVRKKLLIA